MMNDYEEEFLSRRIRDRSTEEVAECILRAWTAGPTGPGHRAFFLGLAQPEGARDQRLAARFIRPGLGQASQQREEEGPARQPEPGRAGLYGVAAGIHHQGARRQQRGHLVQAQRRRAEHGVHAVAIVTQRQYVKVAPVRNDHVIRKKSIPGSAKPYTSALMMLLMQKATKYTPTAMT